VNAALIEAAKVRVNQVATEMLRAAMGQLAQSLQPPL
jgi:hypothetical protein